MKTKDQNQSQCSRILSKECDPLPALSGVQGQWVEESNHQNDDPQPESSRLFKIGFQQMSNQANMVADQLPSNGLSFPHHQNAEFYLKINTRVNLSALESLQLPC